MIHVIATIELHEGRRDDFLAEFHALVPHVLADLYGVDLGVVGVLGHAEVAGDHNGSPSHVSGWTSISPLSAMTWPVIRRSSVVLPVPLGPMTAVTLPRGI